MNKRPNRIRFLLLCMGLLLSGCSDNKHSVDSSEVTEISSERQDDTEEKETEEKGEQFEELDWLEYCYPEVILEITYN